MQKALQSNIQPPKLYSIVHKLMCGKAIIILQIDWASVIPSIPLAALQKNTLHIDLCAIEHSLGDAPTALKHGEGWSLSPYLAFDLKIVHCQFANKMVFCNMILTIRITWENSDFAWEKFII